MSGLMMIILSFSLNKFREDPRLGVAGTIFKEEGGYSSETAVLRDKTMFPAKCQVFRRQCFEEIGGYFANKAGGIDWIAVTTARMMGWKTRSFREKSFFHFQPSGHGRTWRIGIVIFVRREGLLSRWSSRLGVVSSYVSDVQTSLYCGWTGSWAGLRVGDGAQSSQTCFKRTHRHFIGRSRCESSPPF